MIKISKENDLLVESDDSKINLPMIREFLVNDWEFVEESQGIFRRTKETNPASIEQIVSFLREIFQDLEIDAAIQTDVNRREENRQNVTIQRQEALDVKALIEQGEQKVPELEIPRLVDGLELYWYQRLGVQHALKIQNSANFSVPGSGKTWMGYSTFFMMKDVENIVDKLLVIGPKVAVRAWNIEYEAMTGKKPDIKNIKAPEGSSQEIFDNVDQHEIFFVNYSMLGREIDNIKTMLQQHRFLVIADESHHFKNESTLNAINIREIAQHCTRKMILTGTMMPKELSDVYTQFDFLLTDSGILPNFERFKEIYPNDNLEAQRTVSELLNPYFYRISKQRLGLPPQTFNFTINPTTYSSTFTNPNDVVEMYDVQRRIYNVIAEMFANPSEQDRADLLSLARWRKKCFVFLIEAATDPSLLPTDNQFTTNIFDSSQVQDLRALVENYDGIKDIGPPRKLLRAMELADVTLNEGGKVVIWCSFLKTIDKLKKLFHERDIQTREIFGAVPADEEEDPQYNRSLLIDQFREDPNVNVLIANPATLAESVSLQRECHHAIYVDRTFNGGHYMQSLERIHRVGLEPGTITKYDIIQSADSIDQVIHNRLGTRVRRMEEFLTHADLVVGRYAVSGKQNFGNPTGDDKELDGDLNAVLEHINQINDNQ